MATATATAAVDGAVALQLATRLVEDGLALRWAEYRSFRVWRELRAGGVPSARELSAFLARLPTTLPFDTLYPSLQSLRRLQLPWGALLEHLRTALPLRACRWQDEHGREQLLLLLGGRGHLLHCSANGTSLQMRACCMHRLNRRHEMLSDSAESVSTAVACWVWLQCMAQPEKYENPEKPGGGGDAQRRRRVSRVF